MTVYIYFSAAECSVQSFSVHFISNRTVRPGTGSKLHPEPEITAGAILVYSCFLDY